MCSTFSDQKQKKHDVCPLERDIFKLILFFLAKYDENVTEKKIVGLFCIIAFIEFQWNFSNKNQILPCDLRLHWSLVVNFDRNILRQACGIQAQNFINNKRHSLYVPFV